MIEQSSSDTEKYVIVNAKTELVEAGPYPAEEARDKLAEIREKLREQTKDARVYVPIDMKLQRYEDTKDDGGKVDE